MIQPVPYVGEPATIALACLDLDKQIRMRNGFDEASLRGLADTIKAHGVIQPIIVTRAAAAGRFVVVSGERRILAATIAGLAEIPAVIREGTPHALKTVQAVENLQREGLSLADIAEGLHALSLDPAAGNWSQIGKSLGKSPAWVSKHRAALKLRPITRHAMLDGKTEDLDLLLCLDQIERLKTPASHVAVANLVDGLGTTTTRASARAALASLKAPAAKADDTPQTDDEGEGEADDEKPAARKQFAKLELAEHVAREILAALEYTVKNKPSSRPPETTVAHVAAFIAANWPAQ